MYIYGCMCVGLYVCGSVCVFVDASLDGIRLSGRSSFVSLFWHKDHTKGCACMNLCEGLRLEVGVGRTKDIGLLSLRLRVEETSHLRVKQSGRETPAGKDLKQSENGHIGREGCME